MQQFAVEGVSDTYAVINRIMGYVSDLHRIWVNTSDQQPTALSREFLGLYHYARITEEASDTERNKVSWSYDDMAEFSEQHKEMGARLLAAVDTLKRDYQALHADGNLQAFQLHLKELDRLYRQWLSDLDSFRNSLRAQGVEPKVLEYVSDALGPIAEHTKQLTGWSSEFLAVPALSHRVCDFWVLPVSRDILYIGLLTRHI